MKMSEHSYPTVEALGPTYSADGNKYSTHNVVPQTPISWCMFIYCGVCVCVCVCAVDCMYTHALPCNTIYIIH